MTWDNDPRAPQEPWELENMKNDYMRKFMLESKMKAEALELELRSQPLGTFYIAEWPDGLTASRLPLEADSLPPNGILYTVQASCQSHALEIATERRKTEAPDLSRPWSDS